jgi:3-hydroxyisobutyrate dehydrogenase-like beta-hydroxyacid dehydrogenase
LLYQNLSPFQLVFFYYRKRVLILCPPPTMSPQIAFVGLGLMGQEITKNIVKYGGLAQPLILYNRTKSRAEEHSAAIGHSRVAESIEDAILQSDIIWSCLQNDLAVIETFDGVEKLDLKGKLFVESSTIEPGTTDALAKKILEAGAEFVAAPCKSTVFSVS